MRINGSILPKVKCFNTPMLYNTNAHFYNPSVRIGSISFFSSSNKQKFHHLLVCHSTGINSSFNLIFQTKSLIKIIVSGLSSSKLLLSRLISLTSILRIPISLQETTTLPESLLK